MAKLLAGLSNEVLAETRESESMGGLLPTNVYVVGFKAPFINANDKGTIYVQLDVQVLVNPATKQVREMKHVEYISFSGGAFKNDKGETMRGLAAMNGLAQLAGYKSLLEVPTEEKNVKIIQGGKETVQKCDVLVGLRGKKFKAAIQHVKKNRQAKNNQTGKWENINESYEANEIFKFFDFETNQMSSEKADNREAKFMTSWLEANEGKVRDLFKEVLGGNPANQGTQGSPVPAQGNPAAQQDDEENPFT